MEHKLKLQSKYFRYINDGTKRVELRLYDEKRKNINIGDIIEFVKEPELKESIKVKVTGLLRYKSFSALINDLDISILADSTEIKETLLKDLEEFYTSDKQEKCGVLGIRIEKM